MKKLRASGCSQALFPHPPRLPTNDGNRNLHHFQQYPPHLILVFIPRYFNAYRLARVSAD